VRRFLGFFVLAWLVSIGLGMMSSAWAGDSSGWTAKSPSATFKKPYAPKSGNTWVCPSGHQVSRKPGKCLTCGVVMQKKLPNVGVVKTPTPTKK